MARQQTIEPFCHEVFTHQQIYYTGIEALVRDINRIVGQDMELGYSLAWKKKTTHSPPGSEDGSVEGDIAYDVESLSDEEIPASVNEQDRKTVLRIKGQILELLGRQVSAMKEDVVEVNPNIPIYEDNPSSSKGEPTKIQHPPTLSRSTTQDDRGARTSPWPTGVEVPSLTPLPDIHKNIPPLPDIPEEDFKNIHGASAKIGEFLLRLYQKEKIEKAAQDRALWEL
jgi:hypothetical protein